jgi:hypothetical protein
MNTTFEQFWKWLCKKKRTIENLGGQTSFAISAQGSCGIIKPKRSRSIYPFSVCDARLTWVRFHGLRQTEEYFIKRSASKFKKSPYKMAASYALPNNPQNPLPQNWLESPNKMCCPWIAAAIRDFLDHRR